MKPFVIERVFRAPRERVWRAWTDPEALRHWWGPKGFTVTHCAIELRPGGLMHYCLRSPEGQNLWGRFVFREIVEPERLVFIVSFSDETAGVTTHPWSAGWPRFILSTVELAAIGADTKVTVRWIPHEPTELEAKTFEDGRESMQMGWTGTLEQLEAFLAA